MSIETVNFDFADEYADRDATGAYRIAIQKFAFKIYYSLQF